MPLGGTIKLQGESEYRRALSQIKQNLREVSSEMKIVTSTYDKNDTSTEALSAKSDVLSKRLEEQKSKLKLVSDQYKQYQDAVKKSADEHTQLGEKLENAKTKLASIEAQSGKNTKEYEEQKKVVDDLQKQYDESTTAQDKNKKSLSQLAVQMNNAEADVIKTTKEIDNLGKESDDSAKQVDDLSKNMGDADDASKKLSDGFTVLKGTLANLASQAISKVVDGFKELLGGAVDYQKSMEYYTTSFTVMTGSADKASETVKKLADIGAKTPFDMPQLADATSLLMNFGFSANDAVNSMMMLGDISQGNADKLDSIARAYGKMNSAQKVSLEDINMMIDAGFNPLQEISEKTGESMKSLYNRISKGKMSVDEITESMKRSTSEGGKYFKSMDAQSQTLDGRLSTLSDTVNAKLGEALQPILQKAADEWIPNITNAIDNMDMDSVVSVIDDLISGVGNLFGFIMDNGDTIITLVAGIGAAMVTWNVASMINGVVTAVKAYQAANEGASVAQALLNGVMNANPIMLVVTLLAGLIATIITLWNTNEKFRNAVISVWNAFKDTVGNAIKSVHGFIDNLISWFQALPGRIGGFLSQVIGNVQRWASNMVSKASDAGKNFVSNVIDAITNLPSKVATFLSDVISKVTSWASKMASKALTAGKNFVSNVIDAITNLPSKVGTHLKSVITKVTGWASQMASNALSAGKKFVSNVIDAITNLPSKVSGLLSRVISSLATWASNMASKGAEGARRLVTAVVNGVKSLPSKMLSIGGQIVTGLWNGIGDKVGWIISKIKGFGDAVMNAMKKIFDIHSPSRRMRDEVGAMLVKGVVEGVKEEQGKAIKDINSAQESSLKKLYKKRDEIQSKLEDSSTQKSKAKRQQYKEQLEKVNDQIAESQKKHNDKVGKQEEKFSDQLVKAAKTRVEQLEKQNKINEAQEISYWEAVQGYCKKGSDAYNKAATQLASAKAKLKSDVSDLTKSYVTETAKVNEELSKNIEELKKTYSEAISQRQSSITGTLNLFDSFKQDDSKSKEELSKNLETQVNALAEWNNTLTSLESRLGGNTDLIKELDSMGVSSLDNLKELNNMSDDELANYVAMWQQKEAIAKDRAVKENETLKAETDKQVKELKAKAKKQINDLTKTYKNNLKKLGVGMKKPSKDIGKQIMAGIEAGLKAGSGSLSAELSKQCKKLVTQAKKELKIHSPSRVFRDEVGAMITQGISTGMIDEMPRAEVKMKDSLNNLVNSMQGISTISTNFETSSNISTSGNVTGVETSYNNIVNAFKDALSQMKIEMDDEEMGRFVDKTVTKLIYN